MADSRVPWIVAGALVLVLGLGAVLAGGKKKSSKPKGAPPGTRAVIVPAGSRPLTLVVPPCGTGRRIAPAGAQRQLHTQGAAVFQLPPRRTVRTVQVAPCGSTAGAPPAAAFVLQGKKEGGKAGAPLQLVVPNGSTARTLVVPACAGTSKKGASVLPPPAGGSSAALAPPC
ncbi:MAG: hypothetical protein ABR581_00080 [Thermoleophilaceae bacterium]